MCFPHQANIIMLPSGLCTTIALIMAQLVLASATTTSIPGLASVTVPAAFPTSVFSTYYVKPGPTQEPQPALYDPILNKTFGLGVTDPLNIPTHDTDPVYYPKALANLTDASAEAVITAAKAEILDIAKAGYTGLSSNCSKCVAALSVAQIAARLAPTYLPDAMVSFCKETGFASNSTCQAQYEAGSFGATWTQILSHAEVAGLDGQFICAALGSYCPLPNKTDTFKAVFPKPKPIQAKKPPRSSKMVKVLHLSDLHLDARYEAGSEANCMSSMCCRHPTSHPNGASAVPIQVPAPLYGYYKCDSPYYLALAALQSIGPLTGTSKENPAAFALYTGDLVAHDPQNQLSRDYVENIELSVWHMFKSYIGGPVYSALGNHDTSPVNLDVPHGIDDDGPLGQQLSWNYDHVSSLWSYYGWLDNATAAEAATHYAAYSVVHPAPAGGGGGSDLRIITLNTDLYYKNNHFAWLHAADPDFGGMFTFLIAELQKAEDAGQRAWIAGHVLSGWDGTNPLPNGSDLLYQIIERYSPHVVANVFFGHTHEDQAFVYYAHNGTNRSAETALASAWVGPSLTPLTNLNAGYRLYEVDTGTWDVHEAYTFYADVGSFAELDPAASQAGPVFQLEYSTREAYGAQAGPWPADAPLNGTFWHRVTEAMERNRTLVDLVNRFQGKSSVRSPNCTSDACAEAKICYMRSGSAPLGRLCPQGFGSVQSPYTGKNY
ncbi:Metallo-dependent phosphatase-like protein [Apiospora arundinis]|uniref:Metallo-dependent phosphatase-like protein n=1 Tax=Apiospora arundinis TaxID=335852 RepID=A0ABR2HRB9_9PEZI